MYKSEERATDRILTMIHPMMTFKYNGHSYLVDEVYQHNAKCMRDDGVIESFSVGDFVIMGLEDSFPNKTNCKGLS